MIKDNSDLSYSRTVSTGLLALRIYVGAMMLFRAIGKAQNYDYLIDNFPDPLGIGSATTFAIITIIEGIGSALLIIGLYTRISAVVLACGMFVAAFFAFPGKGYIAVELFILYLGVYITLAITGAGQFSLDGSMTTKKSA